MKYLILALAVSGLSVHATTLQPSLGKSMCMARQYTEAHLIAHQKQSLRSIAVIVTNEIHKEYTEGHAVVAKVVGSRNGKLWGNEAGCFYQKDGSVKCEIECDGGAFDLKPSVNGSALFQVRKDYYFPLFVQGSDPENTTEKDILNLNWENKEDRAYRVYPAQLDDCEQVWEMYKHADHGC